MAHLTLAGVSDDGARLLLVTDDGTEHTLDVDARLRAALRGDHARLGELEIQMDSALRPRDIQARIRAGETPDQVAAAAQTTVDKIMVFAGPVLAEREHIADRAQRSSVRRPAGAQTTARTLGDAVASHLRSLDLAPDSISWDAWRREDGRWTVVGDYAAGRHRGSARFSFDPPGNYVVADNDDARWLLGEVEETPRAAPAATAKPQRRLSAVPNEELPLGDDAIEMVAEDPAAAVAPEQEPEPDSDPDEPDPEPDEAPTLEQPAVPDEAPARPARKKGARASVPSWDEIMFGSGDTKHE